MAARAGMATVIATLRRLTNAGVADHTVDGVVYWTDAQLEAVLDRQRSDHHREPLEPLAVWLGGEQVTLDYRIPRHLHDFEEPTEVVTSGWLVHDGAGNDAPAHEVNYAAGLITFAANTSGDRKSVV